MAEIAHIVNDDYITNRIKRAYVGISYIRVCNDGQFYAQLKGSTYTYFNGVEYSGKRNEKAAISIFHRLINRYLNFECDDVYYYYARGKWYYFNK